MRNSGLATCRDTWRSSTGRTNRSWLATTAFLVGGLQSGHRCIYLFDTNTAADIGSALRRANIDVDARIDAGDLVIRDAEAVYLESGFDPTKMIRTLETEANASVEDGYDGLWLPARTRGVSNSNAGQARLRIDLYRVPS